MEHYQRFLDLPWVENFMVHPKPEETPLECVIVEPRAHKNLPMVVKNVSHMLPNAAMTIFHSKENETYVHDIVYANGPNNIKCVCISEGNMNSHQYSSLLASPDFWDTLVSPKTMIFQTDTGIRKNRILKFMEYDYVGAPWSWQVVNGIDGITIGNGGLSLRTKKWMKYYSDTFERDNTYTNPTEGEPEDVFFARHMFYTDDIRLPSDEIAGEFSVEHNDNRDPMGFHKAYDFQKNQDVLYSWFNEGIEMRKSTTPLVQVCDAWIESLSGRIQDVPDLATWLSVGVGPCGLHIPKETYIDANNVDLEPGIQKVLKIKAIPHADGNVYLYTVPLRNNRTLVDLSISSSC
jgi:hypothetical protein